MTRSDRARTADDVPVGGHDMVRQPVEFTAANSTARLPDAIPASLARYFDELVDHIVAEVVAVAPEYASAVSGMRLVVEAAIRYAVSLVPLAEGVAIEDWERHRSIPGPDSVGDFRELFSALGRQEHTVGRAMEPLHSAFFAAGRAAWRFLMRNGGRGDGLSHDQMHQGAEAIFVTIEVISELAAEGYVAAEQEAAGTLEQDRARLVAALTSHPPPSERAVRALAERACWTVPSSVYAVALEPERDGAPATAAPLPPVLCDLRTSRPFLLVPGDTDVTGVAGRRAVIGPTVPVVEAGRSLRLARRAQCLRAAGVLSDEPALRCTDHLVEMLVVASPTLAELLVASVLADLDQFSPRQRERLANTLSEWLRHNGATAEIADALGVHPQTVRYRMTQLRDLFGPCLDDPDDRLRLRVALVADRLLRDADVSRLTDVLTSPSRGGGGS